jgi:hypothetical protein
VVTFQGTVSGQQSLAGGKAKRAPKVRDSCRWRVAEKTGLGEIWVLFLWELRVIQQIVWFGMCF